MPVQNAFRRVQMLGAAVHRDGAALAFQHAAAGPQLGFHGGDAVALLQAQALGVADDGGALTQQAQHHEHRAKVRAVGQVDVHPVQGCLCKGDGVPLTGELCAAPVQEIQNDRVALQGVRGKAGDGHPTAHGTQHRREGRLTVVALYGVIAGVIVLAARQGQRIPIQPAAGHPKGGLHRAGHVDVAAALHRRDEVQGAVAVQQGQGKQQPADELAGHVARQPVFSRCEGAGHG